MSLLEHRRVGADDWQSIADHEMATALLERYQQWVAEATDPESGSCWRRYPWRHRVRSWRWVWETTGRPG